MYIAHFHADIYISCQLEPIEVWSKMSPTRNIGKDPDDGARIGSIGSLANGLVCGNSMSKLNACKYNKRK